MDSWFFFEHSMKKRTNFLFTFCVWKTYFFRRILFPIHSFNQILFFAPRDCEQLRYCNRTSIRFILFKTAKQPIKLKIFKRNVLFEWKINLKKQIQKISDRKSLLIAFYKTFVFISLTKIMNWLLNCVQIVGWKVSIFALCATVVCPQTIHANSSRD